MQNKRKFANWIIAFACIVALGPYFVWSSFSPILSRTPVFLYTITALLLLIRVKKVNKKMLLVAILFVIMWLYTLFNGSTNQYVVLGLYIPMFVGVGVILGDDKDKADIFFKFKILFIISLIPGMFFWILEVARIQCPLPFTYLESTNQAKTLVGAYYNNYYLFLDRIDYNILSNIPHLCGIYDEQGLVGTFAGLILAAEGLEIKKKWNLLLFIQGCMSLSLAFFIIIIFTFLVRSFLIGNLKKVIEMFGKGALCLLFIVCCVYFFVPRESIFYTGFIERFLITSGSLAGDNRMHAYFQNAYDAFKGNIIDYLFGLGRGSYAILSNPDSSSYLILIYEYGIVGFGLIIGYHLTLFFTKYFSKNRQLFVLPFFTVYMLSIYQRPFVLTISYIVLYNTALSYALMRCKDGEKI